MHLKRKPFISNLYDNFYTLKHSLCVLLLLAYFSTVSSSDRLKHKSAYRLFTSTFRIHRIHVTKSAYPLKRFSRPYARFSTTTDCALHLHRGAYHGMSICIRACFRMVLSAIVNCDSRQMPMPNLSLIRRSRSLTESELSKNFNETSFLEDWPKAPSKRVVCSYR